MDGGLLAALAGNAPGLAVAALEQLKEEVRRAVLERLGARRAGLEEVEWRVQQGLAGATRARVHVRGGREARLLVGIRVTAFESLSGSEQQGARQQAVRCAARGRWGTRGRVVALAPSRQA